MRICLPIRTALYSRRISVNTKPKRKGFASFTFKYVGVWMGLRLIVFYFSKTMWKTKRTFKIQKWKIWDWKQRIWHWKFHHVYLRWRLLHKSRRCHDLSGEWAMVTDQDAPVLPWVWLVLGLNFHLSQGWRGRWSLILQTEGRNPHLDLKILSQFANVSSLVKCPFCLLGVLLKELLSHIKQTQKQSVMKKLAMLLGLTINNSTKYHLLPLYQRHAYSIQWDCQLRWKLLVDKWSIIYRNV